LCYYTSEVACPYFYPLEPEGGGTPQSLSSSSAHHDAMLPLGGRWRGTCRAHMESAAEPEESMRPVCNLGYARGVCRHFPAGDGPDAVRFTVTGDAGGRLALYYVVERDHHPFAHGPLEYTRDTGAIVTPPDETLCRQAQAYAESYRRRKEIQEGRT
jgi:hypothetical protein